MRYKTTPVKNKQEDQYCSIVNWSNSVPQDGPMQLKRQFRQKQINGSYFILQLYLMDRTFWGSARVGSHAYLISNWISLSEATSAFLANKVVSKNLSRKDYSIALFETWLEMNHSSPYIQLGTSLDSSLSTWEGVWLHRWALWHFFEREKNKVCSDKLLLVSYPWMQRSLTLMPENWVCYQYMSPSADCQ